MADSSGDGRLAADAMGTRDLVFTVLAALAPLTLVVALAPLHFLKGGAAVPGGYIVAGVVMALFAVGFMTMSRYVRNAGAFYAMIAKGLGKPLGSGAATLALLAYNALQISTYGALGLYSADSFSRYTGVDLPWWLFALVGAALVGYLGFRGIQTSARILGVLLVLEIAILAVMAVFVLAKGGAGETTFTSFSPSEVLTPANGAMFALVFGAFMGFEATAIFSEEARGGIRTVRRATYIAVAFIAVFYAFITWTIVQAIGADGVSAAAEADLEGMVVGVFESYTPGAVTAVMEILLLTSAFAALLALHNAANRYLFSLGREGLVPAAFGRTHPRTRAPYLAGFLQTAVAMLVLIVWAVFGLDPYLGLLLWGSSIGFLGIIALWALCAVAVVVYLRRNHPETGLWRSLIAPGLSFVGLVVVLSLVLANFGLLTGGGTTTNTILLVMCVVAFISGIVSAVSLRSRSPERYARLTETRVDDAVPEPA
ncbi:APC family permease [Actinocorallia sp. A-T 12471]|uniref:APC family permease n=1 Tax=Actinocorallia sp. A-T 12471 TaxID=3089813 RepID=UPI0029D3657B|nr:APC family permease [Actinocorallia sp. A-T 12471]MDX6744797.1 APC family permease [Actinocorallia sp. A-T 12471]